MSACNFCTNRRLTRKYGQDRVEIVPQTVGGEWPEAVSLRLKGVEGDDGLLSWFMALPDRCCCHD